MFSRVGAWKILQTKGYSRVFHRCSLLRIAIFVTIVLALSFGETWLIRNSQNNSHFSAFNGNMNGKPLQEGLFHHVPIDIVYTWVNGSDPELLKNLMKVRLGIENSDDLPSSANDDANLVYGQQCSFQKCIASQHMTLKCQFPRNESLNSIRSSDSALANATEVRNLGSIKSSNSHWILISFPSEEEVLSALTSLKKSNTWPGQNCSVHHAYWTLEEELPLSYSMPRTIIVSGLPKAVRLSHLTSSPLGKFAAAADILLYRQEGAAVIMLSSTTIMDNIFKLKLLLSGNLSILGNEVKLQQATLVLELPNMEAFGGLSPSRFEDKEELRYSLRSVEKYAPWVRHIWLVTNGQIPNWINLDHPRLTLITHEEIFLNKSHLPTFNSRAIESHLHRIPGITEKFLYMNDDMFFGSEVWPDDFYTAERGVKLHLSWPVPLCHEKCSPYWIGNGYCNPGCNNSECHWDKGDCKPKQEVSTIMNLVSSFLPPVKRSVEDEAFPRINDKNEEIIGSDYNMAEWCSPLCAIAMLGDKHCDMDCNILACGFDGGDCGTTNSQGLNAQNAFFDDSHALGDNVYDIGQRWRSRRLQDTFSAAIQHVNYMYDEQYGIIERRVPAHAGYFIVKNIMEELQERYSEEWEETSSHRIRDAHDMQYSFSYFYYIMSEKRDVPITEIFDDFDLDHSGTWSDQEIRWVLNGIYNIQSTDDDVLQFERTLISCSRSQGLNENNNMSSYEWHMDSELLTVSKALIVGCQPINKLLTEKFGERHRFKHQVLDDSKLYFRKIISDLKAVAHLLNEIQKVPRKFICLNDDLDPDNPQVNDKIRILLKHFYHSLFPNSSTFELPPGYLNHFHNKSELREWQRQRLWLQIFAYICIVCVVMLSLVKLFFNKVVKLWRHSKHQYSNRRKKTKGIAWA